MLWNLILDKEAALAVSSSHLIVVVDEMKLDSR
jgi:hypothetical protein